MTRATKIFTRTCVLTKLIYAGYVAKITAANVTLVSGGEGSVSTLSCCSPHVQSCQQRIVHKSWKQSKLLCSFKELCYMNCTRFCRFILRSHRFIFACVSKCVSNLPKCCYHGKFHLYDWKILFLSTNFYVNCCLNFYLFG